MDMVGELDSEVEGIIDLVRQRAASRRLLRQPSEALAALGLRSAIEPGESSQLNPVAPASGAEQEEGGEGAAGSGQNPSDTPMEVDQPGEWERLYKSVWFIELDLVPGGMLIALLGDGW